MLTLSWWFLVSPPPCGNASVYYVSENQGTLRLGTPALFAGFARLPNSTPEPLFPTVVANFQRFPDGCITSCL